MPEISTSIRPYTSTQAFGHIGVEMAPVGRRRQFRNGDIAARIGGGVAVEQKTLAAAV